MASALPVGRDGNVAGRARGRSGSLWRSELECVGDVPWQQFFHTADRVIGNQGDDMPQIGFGIEAIELGRADQAIQAGSALPSGIRTGEEVVFAVMLNLA